MIAIVSLHTNKPSSGPEEEGKPSSGLGGGRFIQEWAGRRARPRNAGGGGGEVQGNRWSASL